MRKTDERTRLFMEFFAKEFGVKFRDCNTGEEIVLDDSVDNRDKEDKTDAT